MTAGGEAGSREATAVGGRGKRWWYSFASWISQTREEVKKACLNEWSETKTPGKQRAST